VRERERGRENSARKAQAAAAAEEETTGRRFFLAPSFFFCFRFRFRFRSRSSLLLCVISLSSFLCFNVCDKRVPPVIFEILSVPEERGGGAAISLFFSSSSRCRQGHKIGKRKKREKRENLVFLFLLSLAFFLNRHGFLLRRHLHIGADMLPFEQ
jgi:hypothetical protein